MKREKVKEFWVGRANLNTGKSVPRIESIVNFESNKDLAELRINQEINCVREHMSLGKDDIVVDLGAGFGQWALRLAPQVKKVYAVEYIDEFIEMGKKTSSEMNIGNIEYIQCAAEDFIADFYITHLFVSGLLHYLDYEQYEKTINNILKYVPKGNKVFLRESVSLLETEYELDDKYSEAMKTNYSSLYRTAKQHIDAFTKRGFKLENYGQFFEDGSPLNKFPETRLYYFSFIKG
jgi:ubiquinone/menaquinone biosynthesis C-methylase UbiE